MKKLSYLVLITLLAGSSLSWHWEKNQHAQLDKSTVISCLNMETQQAYQIEASQAAFANLHIAPKAINVVDLEGKTIEFMGADGQVGQAYFIAAKKPSKKWLIVIQEWWGLNAQIKEEADQYYKDLGDMNVMAIDMYDGKVANTPDSAMKLMRTAKMERMVALIQGAIKHAGTKADIYSVGWCFGGMWSLQTAILAGPQAKGAVMYYGRPESNMDKLKSIQCEVIGFFGNQDKSPSPELVSEFEKNMLLAGKKLTAYKYEAGHGFANPSNPSYNASAKADSYAKAIAFLKAH